MIIDLVEGPLRRSGQVRPVYCNATEAQLAAQTMSHAQYVSDVQSEVWGVVSET